MRTPALVFVLLVFLQPAAMPQVQFNFGSDMNRQITPDEMAQLVGRAEKGDGQAQFQLGNYYFLGIGQKKDPIAAFQWWGKAADQKIVSAQLNLAQMYLFGFGTSRDTTRGLDVLKAAAANGSIRACVILSDLYGGGIGVPADQEASAKWVEKAAELGDAYYQYTIARYYSEGHGVPEDDVQALKWYRRAAENGNKEAKRAVAGMELGGLGTKPDPVAAFMQFRELADDGDADSQWQVGLAYARGTGVVKNSKEATSWMEKAASAGPHAIELGDFYAAGQLLPRDDAKAAQWYEHDKGEWGVFKLARMYELGRGVPQDYAKAAELYERSAERRNPRAQLALAKLHASGKGVTKNMTRALDLARRAADGRLSEVEFEVAVDYSASRGVPEDDAIAAEWFRKAAVHDNGLAQWNLARRYATGKGLAANPEAAYVWYEIASHRYYGAKGASDQVAQVMTAAQIREAGHEKELLEQVLAERGGYYEAPKSSVLELSLAAEAGDPEAAFQLAYACDRGLGLTTDANRALQWYGWVVDHAGTALHQQLVDFYRNPSRKNEALAAKWRRAAEEDSKPSIP